MYQRPAVLMYESPPKELNRENKKNEKKKKRRRRRETITEDTKCEFEAGNNCVVRAR